MIYEDVLRLEISVHHILSMAVSDCRDDLLNYDGCIFLFKKLSLGDFIEKFSSSANLCDEVVSLVILVEFIELDDVRMVQSLKNFNLMSKSLDLKVIKPFFS